MIFIDWFYPAYKAGGPITSVYNIVSAVAKEIDFSIVTSDQDLDGSILEVERNRWIDRESHQIIYLSKESQNASTIKRLYADIQADVLYFNSMFSVKFTLIPYRALKKKAQSIIAPRGMLGKGALEIKSMKKKVFLSLSKNLLFSKKVIWHASTEMEEQEIKLIFGQKAKVCIAQNLSSLPQERKNFPQEKIKDQLRLVFFSRISLKKNLLFLLEVMQDLKENKSFSLDIYGPIEDEAYWEKCQKIILEDPRIQYIGILKPQEVSRKLQDYHFSILPTQHENYGHTIVESINAGVPVVISENTPWKDLEQENIGRFIKLENKERWGDYFKELLKLEEAEYKNMSTSCFNYSKRNIVSSAVIDQNKNLFKLEH